MISQLIYAERELRDNFIGPLHTFIEINGKIYDLEQVVRQPPVPLESLRVDTEIDVDVVFNGVKQ